MEVSVSLRLQAGSVDGGHGRRAADCLRPSHGSDLWRPSESAIFASMLAARQGGPQEIDRRAVHRCMGYVWDSSAPNISSSSTKASSRMMALDAHESGCGAGSRPTGADTGPIGYRCVLRPASGGERHTPHKPARPSTPQRPPGPARVQAKAGEAFRILFRHGGPRGLARELAKDGGALKSCAAPCARVDLAPGYKARRRASPTR